MGQKRNLIIHGNSTVATIPKNWLDLIQEKEGKRVIALEMTVNENLLFKPIFEKQQGDKIK